MALHAASPRHGTRDMERTGERLGFTQLMGKRVEFSYHDLIPPFMLVMRVTFGFIFIWAGFEKLIEGFSAEGFLVNATSGPLQGWFAGMAGNGAVEGLVVWGQILIGIALIFGLFTRFAALAGATMMFLFYIAQFPPEHNPFMDYYLVYVLVCAMLAALGAGRFVGLDRYLERLPIVGRYPAARYLLG